MGLLEKLTPLTPEDRDSMESSVESVFLQHASYLRIPCHTIYTFPLWLRYRTPSLGSVYDCAPLVLPMVKIRERNGERSVAGTAKLREVVARRVDVAAVFGANSDATLLPLIDASGGYVRDLLRLVRDVVKRGERAGFPVSGDLVAGVISTLREDYRLVVDAGDLDLLVEVARHKQLLTPDGARTAALGRLLDRWVVLYTARSVSGWEKQTR